MAESSWPSPSNSRQIADDQYEKLAVSYGPSAAVVGEFTSPQLVYGDASGMQVKVAADRYAIVRGHEWWSGSTIITQPIAANSSGSTRIDLVVLRLSRTTWDVNLTVIQGTPGAGAPALVQNVGTTGSFDLPLAVVTVANGASSLSAGNVSYIGPHLSAYGDLRLLSSASLPYVPQPTTGMVANTTDGNSYRYHNGGWETFGGEWVDYNPILYSNISVARNPVTRTVAMARYKLLGGICFMEASVSNSQATNNGAALQLPFVAYDPQPIIGSAVITGSSASSSQMGVAFMVGPGNGDSIACITQTTAFIDQPIGHYFRCSVQYRVA